MGIARSTFYEAPAMATDDTALVEAMHAIKDEFEAYGWRRLQAALRQQGWVVNHKKIKRLMQVARPAPAGAPSVRRDDRQRS
jgi:putative transposase